MIYRSFAESLIILSVLQKRSVHLFSYLLCCLSVAEMQYTFGPATAAGRLRAGLNKHQWLKRTVYFCRKAFSYVGPGLMVAIAYMDPGNYSTDTAAGAGKQFSLLFVILLSTLIAVYLQTIAVKLASATGKDLARNCRDHLPKWIGFILYIFAECAIIATDIAEVIGTAVALDILLHIPLIAGVCLTILDVILVLLAYKPGNSMRIVRIFEGIIALLLLVVVFCFVVLLTKIPPTNVGHLFRGYLPSHEVISDGGIYMAAGILGATVMPHSLYLGSSMAISRVREVDMRNGYIPVKDEEDEEDYLPSRQAVDKTYRYAVIELVLSLCTVAIFVNSTILIVAGDTMYGSKEAQDADLYTLYDMLKKYLDKGAAVTFMVALLCSGQSAGIICTIAGQIVSEGHLHWRCRPWLRRIFTRLIAIIPCLVVVGVVGKKGLADTLNWSQVVLTITLPFLSAPLIYLTGRDSIMSVHVESYANEKSDDDENDSNDTEDVINGAPGGEVGLSNVHLEIMDKREEAGDVLSTVGDSSSMQMGINDAKKSKVSMYTIPSLNSRIAWIPSKINSVGKGHSISPFENCQSQDSVETYGLALDIPDDFDCKKNRAPFSDRHVRGQVEEIPKVPEKEKISMYSSQPTLFHRIKNGGSWLKKKISAQTSLKILDQESQRELYMVRRKNECRRRVVVKSYACGWISIIFGALLVVFIGVVNVYLLVVIGIQGSP